MTRIAKDNAEGGYKPPSATEFRSLLMRWGDGSGIPLSGYHAGKMIARSGRAIRRYTSGVKVCPYAVLFTLAMKREGRMISADNWRVELGIAGSG